MQSVTHCSCFGRVCSGLQRWKVHHILQHFPHRALKCSGIYFSLSRGMHALGDRLCMNTFMHLSLPSCTVVISPQTLTVGRKRKYPQTLTKRFLKTFALELFFFSVQLLKQRWLKPRVLWCFKNKLFVYKEQNLSANLTRVEWTIHNLNAASCPQSSSH